MIAQGDIRILIALANKFDWNIHQAGVQTAFLNSDLEEKVFMKIPDGLQYDANFKNNHVCQKDPCMVLR